MNYVLFLKGRVFHLLRILQHSFLYFLIQLSARVEQSGFYFLDILFILKDNSAGLLEERRIGNKFFAVGVDMFVVLFDGERQNGSYFAIAVHLHLEDGSHYR